MIVIADATPLHYLILIEQTEILPRLFKQIVIPTAVVTELQRPKAPESVRAWIAAPPTWLGVRSAVPKGSPELDRLGAGEREAILLGEELQADWLIIDDREGRHEAMRRHLPVIGTLRVLDEAADRGFVKLPAVLERLRQTTFHISPELTKWLLDRDVNRPRAK